MTSSHLKFCYNDIIRLRNGREGIIQFIGPTSFNAGVWYGIELMNEHRGQGSNNGCVEDRQYFECDENCGVFVLKKRIEMVLEMSQFFTSDERDEEKEHEESDHHVLTLPNMSRGRWTVGDEVNIQGKGNGVIEYVGHTGFGQAPMKSVWFGIALSLPTGSHRGRVEDVMYFATKWNHGIFVKLDKLRPYDESANLPSYLSARATLSSRSGYSLRGVSVASRSTSSAFSPRGLRKRSKTVSHVSARGSKTPKTPRSGRRKKRSTKKSMSVPPQNSRWVKAGADGRRRSKQGRKVKRPGKGRVTSDDDDAATEERPRKR